MDFGSEIELLKASNDVLLELQRKLIHLSSLWLAGCIYWLDWWQAAAALFFVVFLFLLAYDWLRYKKLSPACVEQLLQPVLRSKEGVGFCLTGATWMLLAVSLCTVLFEQYIAFAAVLVLVVSDSCAALVGKAWGSVAVLEKSLQGTVAFVVSAWLCLAFVGVVYGFSVSWYLWILIPSLTTALVELFSGRLRLDDNLSIPLSLALTLQALSLVVA